MAHTSTKIYRNTATTPNQGVCIADIQAVLGSSRNDIGGLITYGDINKWAKYKPVRSSALKILTDSDRAQVMWGLSIDTSFNSLGSPTTVGSFLYKLVHGQLAWDYLRPRGQSQVPKEWFRFLDFDGYISDAVCPIGDPDQTTIFVQSNGTAQIAWDIISDNDLDPGNLSLNDIYVGNTPLSSYYLGVLLYRSNLGTFEIVTSDDVIGPNGTIGDVQITISNFPQGDLGDWTAYPFFSSVPITFGGQGTTGSYISAGWGEESIELHFRASSETLAFYAWGIWHDSTHTTIDVEWDAYNEVSTARTVTPTLVLVYAAEGVQPGQGSLAAQVSLGSVTVPAASGGIDGHTSGTATITRPSNIAYDDYVWWLGISVPNFATNYEQIEEPDSPISE